jgi:hypothetical protein
MPVELSKKDRRIAGELIAKGLEAEFAKCLELAYRITLRWKNGETDVRNSYYKLFTQLTDFDKHIASRYDGMSGSRYTGAVADLIFEGWIKESDISEMQEETKNEIMTWVQLKRSR